MYVPLLGCRRVAAERPSQRTIEVILGVFQKRCRSPEQAFCDLEIRVLREATLSLHLVELVTVERSESAREPPERSDQRELSGAHLDRQAEARLLCERKPALGFAFHVNQVIACEQHVRVEVDAAAGCIDHIADAVCDLEAATQKITAAPHRLHPLKDRGAERHVSARLY